MWLLLGNSIICVCMILPGGGCRLQTCRGLAAQWFDSTLRTFRLQLCAMAEWNGRFIPIAFAELGFGNAHIDSTIILVYIIN